MKSASEALTSIWHEISAELYQQQASAQQQGPSGNGGSSSQETDEKKDKEAVDADFEVVDDK
jgi:hypothetical protein